MYVVVTTKDWLQFNIYIYIYILLLLLLLFQISLRKMFAVLVGMVAVFWLFILQFVQQILEV